MRRLVMMGCLAILALGAACSSGEPIDQSAQPMPTRTEPNVAQQQAQPAPVKFTVADAVRVVAEINGHAEDAKTRSQNVQGCDVNSEQAAESVREALRSAQEARADLTIGLAIYLEGASLADLDGANDLIAAADAGVQSAEEVVADMGTCGPLTDDQIVELIDKMRDATTEYSIGLGGARRSIRDDPCLSRYAQDFEQIERAGAEFRALRSEYDAGAGSRERKWISAEIDALRQMRVNFNLKEPSGSRFLTRYRECPKGD